MLWQYHRQYQLTPDKTGETRLTWKTRSTVYEIQPNICIDKRRLIDTFCFNYSRHLKLSDFSSSTCSCLIILWEIVAYNLKMRGIRHWHVIYWHLFRRHESIYNLDQQQKLVNISFYIIIMYNLDKRNLLKHHRSYTFLIQERLRYKKSYKKRMPFDECFK